MKKRFVAKKWKSSEQGMALIAAMMCLLLLTGLGLAALYNSTGDVAISGGFRRNDQAFFAADAGVGLARETLRIQLNNAIMARAAEAANPPAGSTLLPITMTAGQTTFDQAPLLKVLGKNSDGTEDATLLGTTVSTSPINKAVAAITTRSNGLALGSGGTFTVNPGDITLSIDNIVVGTPLAQPTGAVVPVTAMPGNSYWVRYRYSITSRGNFNGGSANSVIGANATAKEVGYVTVQLNPTVNVSQTTQPVTTRSFSSYAALWNHNGLSGCSGCIFDGGIYSGPIHMNDWFRFGDFATYRFKDAVTQGGNSSSANPATFQYYASGNTNYAVGTGNNLPTMTFDPGSTFTKVAPLAIPTNAYQQDWAVLDSVGRDASNNPRTVAPTNAELSAGLSTASRTHPNPTVALPNGVYLSSTDTTSVTGGGIIVKGDVSDFKVYKDSSGRQNYDITQSGVITTVRVTITDPVAGTGTTSIKVGSGSFVDFTGVPMDRTANSTPNASTLIYVEGNIAALHGLAKTGSGSTAITAPAIASNTKLLISSSKDITITGDLKYTDQVVNNDGTPISANQSATNIMGVFTATGKITYNSNLTYTAGAVGDLTIDGAMAAFNEPAYTANPNVYSGGFGDCGLSGAPACGFDKTKATLTIRGSQTYTQDLLHTYGFGSNGSKPLQFIFDPRFRNSAKSPPWFPTANVTNTTTTTSTFALTFGTSNVSSESNTWQRIAY